MNNTMLLAAASPWITVGIVLAIAIVILVVLYFWGKKMQQRQADAEIQMEAMKQTVSMLVIDKKMLRPKESGLPEAALAQIPWYAKRTKMPIVKAKVGPQILSMMADQKVFDVIPVKKECKVVVSGIYISEIKSVRGGKIPEAPKKVGFFKRTWNKISGKNKETK